MDALLDKARLTEDMCRNRATCALFRFDFLYMYIELGK